MSEAAEPAQPRRGPVNIQHPLEIPIDPETGDPVRRTRSTPKKQLERLPGKDRFNLTPVSKGWYRGSIANVIRTSEITPVGTLETFHFDVLAGDGVAPLKVEMVGYTFSKVIRAGIVVEAYVGSPYPTERVRIDRFLLTHDAPNEMRAYAPVENQIRKAGSDRKGAIIALIAPIVVVCGLIYLFGHVFHVF
jgi:hypothetical protein